MVELEPLEVVVPELEVDASERVDNDARMANLLTIMSRFTTRMDHQQEQLSSIQEALMSPTPESGALDLGGTGNFSNVTTRATKRGWARPGVRVLRESRCPGPKISSLGRAGNLAYFTMSWTSCNLFKGVSALLTALTIRL
jgi:hypothetical protein